MTGRDGRAEIRLAGEASPVAKEDSSERSTTNTVKEPQFARTELTHLPTQNRTKTDQGLLLERFDGVGDDDNDSYYSECSLSTVGDLEEMDSFDDETETLLAMEQHATSPSKSAKKREFDVSAYVNGRELTPLQEKMNAITVVPNALFCLYFLLSGRWLSKEAVEMAGAAMRNTDGGVAVEPLFPDEWSGSRMDRSHAAATFSSIVEKVLADESGCIRSALFPNLHALPPLPVAAIAMGIILHAPFSFLYHWCYASRLPPGMARINHWSRRLDQAFIHVASTFISYGTSGSWDYFLANLMFNIDCIYRLFKPRVRPRLNKIRLFISVVAYTIPILWRDISRFCELWVVFAVSGWLFAKYPIGGWSHAAFHIVIALAPPLVMGAACHLQASQGQIQTAVRCAVLAG